MTTKGINVPQMALPGFGMETHGDRHRLFFALTPDATIRSQISRAAEHLKAQQHPRGSWITPDRYHLTLHFLGDNSELRHDVVDRAIAAAEKIRVPVFDLLIDSAASFRSPTPPWVLRCPEPSESIQQLWRALRISLVGERIRSESGSAFTPHVTLLRDADKPLAPCPIEPIVWPVRDFVLIHSQLGRERRYTELRRWPLLNAEKLP